MTAHDPINHPRHYTGHPCHTHGVTCSYGTETNTQTRRHIREADSCRTGSRELQHALEVRMSVWRGNPGLSAELAVGPRSELRVQEGGRCSGSTQRQSDPERLRVREGSESPEGKSEEWPGPGAHLGNGEVAESTPPAGGGSAPQERDQERQPSRESGAVESQPASGCQSCGPGRVGKGNLGEVPRQDGEDPVNHPSHYTSSPASCECGRGIECIEITEHMNFCVGNAVKYLWRAGLKGDGIEDLRKAAWYVQREIDRLIEQEGSQS